MKVFQIGDVLKVSSGGTPSRKNNNYFENGKIPWIKTGDLKLKYLNKASEHITELGLENSSAKLFPPRTVLIAMYGATIGACSILNFEAATNQACAALFPTEKVHPEYLYYFLKANKESIVKRGVGGAQPNISATIIKSIKIPLPPLKTQKHIAKILDDAAALRDKTKQLLTEYDLLAQSIFLEMFGDPYHNPKDFELVKISYFIDKLESGKSVNSTNEDYLIGEKGILKTSSVYDGVFNVAEAKVICEDEVDKAKLNPVKDSIIISRMNTEELVGKSAYIDKDYHNLFLPDRLWQTVKTKNQHSVLWLSHAISQNSFMKSISRIATGTSGSMKNVSQKKFLKLNIINPPIHIQNKFAEKIALIEQQKALTKQELQESEDLFNSLLQKAFKGELV